MNSKDLLPLVTDLLEEIEGANYGCIDHEVPNTPENQALVTEFEAEWAGEEFEPRKMTFGRNGKVINTNLHIRTWALRKMLGLPANF